MKKYKVKIRTPNIMILWRGKLVRTPVNLIAEEKDLSKIQLFIHTEGITDYDISEYYNDNYVFDTPEMIGKEIIVEEIKEESKSILNNLLRSEKG